MASKCPWWSSHDFIPCGKEKIIYPKRGPFDPRTEEQRTYSVEIEICAQCGTKRAKREVVW